MADINYNPEYVDPINDGSTKDDVPEKPYYDDVEAPIPQMVNNYNQPQPQYYNNDIPPQNDIQQGSITNTTDGPYNSSQASNNYYNNQYESNTNVERPVPAPVRRKYRLGENPRTLMIMSIILILIVLADVILEICFSFFSPMIIADDIAILTMAIVYLILIAKKRPTNHPALGAVTVFVWFVGFGVKGFGMTKAPGKIGLMLPLFLLTGGRAFAMFFCIPHTCNNYSRR